MPFLRWIAELLGATLMLMSVSAYDDSQGVAPFKGLTASGATTRPGVAACGPSLYKQTLWIRDVGFVTCLDTGKWVKDSDLDLWKQTNEEANAWGRRTRIAVVLPLPTPGVMPVWKQ